MKKIIYILTVVILGMIMVSSCSDFLDENPKSVNTKETYYTDWSSLQAGIVGMYQGIINLYVINTNTPIFLSMIGTDELCYRAVNTNVRSVIDRYTYTSTEGCIGELWARYYAIIGRTNVIIAVAESMSDLTEAQRNQALSEAKFLRAWSYFQLVQFFGDLPLILEETTEFDYTKSRSPIKNVYKAIIEDLEFAVKPGVLKTEITDGHANHWAAKTLLGKIYLTMASYKESAKVPGYAQLDESVQNLYQKAYDILLDIKDNSGRDLMPVYSDLFEVANKNTNIESIWEIQFSAEEPYGTQWAKEMGLTHAGYSQTSGGWRYCPIGGSFNLNAVPSFRGYYKSWQYDVRKDWNITDSLIRYNATTGVPTRMDYLFDISGIKLAGDVAPYDTVKILTRDNNSTLVQRTSATKYRWGGSWQTDYPIKYIYSNCPNNIIVFRFADVLLMFTEADMKLNGGTATTEGLKAINRVVQRARGLDSNGIPVPESATPGFEDYTASTLTFEELMKERARELCFEFWRRHDLARTGMFEHFMTSRNATSNIKTFFDPDKSYLLPIPQYEIDNSLNKEGMYQNPGYID
ncbi:MAG: RagB/SusD family nutrient uptake outer membrane protein [Prevotellaceae bacterium]|jgi:hypothetical protein|nr:RagB/SusD family nutrient uptake outer membrane protein [Prevotellaceae bacterium]